MKKRELLFIMAILVIAYLLFFSISSLTPLIRSILSEPLFITDLLGNGRVIPNQIILFCNFLNIVLIWYLGKKVINSQFGILSAFLYAVSPWTIYLAIANSIYIFSLTWMFLIFIGLRLINENKNNLTQIVLSISVSILLFSHIVMWFLTPVLLIGFFKLNSISLDKLKLFLIMTIIVCLPIPLLMLRNPIGVKNILNNHIKIFSDVGILNTVGSFQGESKKAGLGTISRLTENRYTYLFKYAIFKSIKQVVPSTYFTPQEKLLDFSFSPPIYIGFIIPFLYGLLLVIKSPILRKYLLLSLILIIPSFLAKDTVDLNKLVVFMPVIIFLISYGFIKLYESKKNKAFRFILYLIIGLFLLQLQITIFDVYLREYPRYESILGLPITKL